MAFDKTYYDKRKEDINVRYQKNKDKVINSMIETLHNFQADQAELNADYKAIADLESANAPKDTVVSTAEDLTVGKDGVVTKEETKSK